MTTELAAAAVGTRVHATSAQALAYAALFDVPAVAACGAVWHPRIDTSDTTGIPDCADCAARIAALTPADAYAALIRATDGRGRHALDGTVS